MSNVSQFVDLALRSRVLTNVRSGRAVCAVIWIKSLIVDTRFVPQNQ